MDKAPVSFIARVLRKEDFLPRYIVIGPECIRGCTQAFAADVMLNDIGPFRRNIRPWGKGSPVFFVNLTAAQCKKAGLETNDHCKVVITSAETA